MKKPLILIIIGLVILIAVLAGVKALQIGAMVEHGKKFVPMPETATSALVKAASWETDLTSVGTLTAIQGITVSAELPGKVVKIYFEAGTKVKKGDILLRQDTSSEEAQLAGIRAQVNLTRTNLERSRQLLAKDYIARAEYDSTLAAAEQAEAQAENIQTAIAKKTIQAPFNGHIGIRQVNLGQNLREGDPIVTLQTLNPIYVDFNLPQQQISLVRLGMIVQVATDAFPDEKLEGRITAINPLVDSETRQNKVQATVADPEEKLRPGMFVTVAVRLPARLKVLIIPGTAVLYAPYGDSVFVIDDSAGKKGKVLRQQFVRLGIKRGDFVAVSSGLQEGQSVVSTGVFKLRNNQSVVIDNKLAPDFRESPKPENN